MSDTPTTPIPPAQAANIAGGGRVRDWPELRKRMMAGETLHHGLAPGKTRSSWWLRPSMTPVAARAAKEFQKEAKTR